MLKYFCPHGIILHRYGIPIERRYEAFLIFCRSLFVLCDFCPLLAKLADKLYRVLRVVGIVSLILTEYKTNVLAVRESRPQNIVMNSLAHLIILGIDEQSLRF